MKGFLSIKYELRFSQIRMNMIGHVSSQTKERPDPAVDLTVLFLREYDLLCSF